MPHEDHLTAAALGELHEPCGVIRMTRIESLGAHDAKRNRYNVTVEHHVAAIHVLPRSGDFEALVELVAEIPQMSEIRHSRHVTLVDVTHAGRAALEPLRNAGIKTTPVMVTSSIGARNVWGAAQVGEPELAGRIAIVLAEDRLRVDPALEGAQELAAQLEKFTTGRPSRPGTPQPVARQELVRGLALALWWSDRRMAIRLEQPQKAAPAIDCRAPTFDEALRLARR